MRTASIDVQMSFDLMVSCPEKWASKSSVKTQLLHLSSTALRSSSSSSYSILISLAIGVFEI
jgi:hypothetical protein